MTPDGGIRIDRAKPGDAEPLARVYVETWRAAYAGLLPDRVLVAMRESVHKSRFSGWIGRQTNRQFILVAREPDAGVVGLCSAGRARGGQKTDGEIYLLYVDQDWQNRGIGRSLLSAALRGLRAGGFGRATLWVLAGNPSRFFYEAAGGVRAAERTERLWGADLAEVSYVWPDLETV
ncbi:MAG: GNAT family N-acetyltransferase [Rhodospirillaceae bacterium]|nr:GNAT family N-acetyltransferase [Rhodospirillaceae bacterium]